MRAVSRREKDDPAGAPYTVNSPDTAAVRGRETEEGKAENGCCRILDEGNGGLKSRSRRKSDLKPIWPTAASAHSSGGNI
jgi:hypothetical protein